MEINQQRLCLIGLIAVFLLSAASLWLSLCSLSAKKFGTVDMQTLLSDQSQKLAKAYPDGTVPNGVMQQVVQEMKEVIHDYGVDQDITLFAKGAVLSGELPDYTDSFKEILSDSEGKPRSTVGRGKP
jgi:hypothetical protein